MEGRALRKIIVVWTKFYYIKKCKACCTEENSIRSKIHVIRGQQVMLDFDLAEIYGYSTKAFNQQIKNNIERFDEDFRFQLSDAEVSELSRSKFLTSMQTKGIKGGRTYNP